MLNATELLTWQQLYPMLEGMAHDSVGDYTSVQKAVDAFEARQLLVGKSMLSVSTELATSL